MQMRWIYVLTLCVLRFYVYSNLDIYELHVTFSAKLEE